MSDGSALFRFSLYIASDTSNSTQAIANLRAICGRHLPGRHTIEFIDVFKEPNRAFEERIFMTPTLVKLGPAPRERIVGTLTDTNLVLRVLGLEEIDS